MSLLDPSLLVAAGASFLAGVLGYIIARLWIKPIVGYNITKRRLADELTRYLAHLNGKTDDERSGKQQFRADEALWAARKHAMDLLSHYSTDIPYWYRLLLDSRKESPTEASGLLTNVSKIRDPDQRKARIEAARQELRLR